MKRHHLFILLSIVLASCSSNSGLTSFGNRKYTKGYFLDNPTKIEAKGTVSKSLRSTIVTQPQQPLITKIPAKQSEIGIKNNAAIAKKELKLKVEYTPQIEIIINSKTQVKNTPPVDPSSTSAKAIDFSDIAYVLVFLGYTTIAFLLVLQLLPLWWGAILFLIIILFIVVGNLSQGKKRTPTRFDLWFFSQPFFSFILNIYSVLCLLAIHKYLNDSQALIPGTFFTFHIASLVSFYLFIALTMFMAIKALLKPGVKYKGWAWAALVISLILLILSFVLRYA